MNNISDYLQDILNDTLDIKKLAPREQQKLVLAHRDNPATQSVDIIWTQTSSLGTGQCCMAITMGWQYGINSKDNRVCKYADISNHKVVFVDNPYSDYVHRKHLEVVKKIKPKYATVRDIMSKEQCLEAGIEYYPLEQILDWAEEIIEYCENVIIIPKIDVLDRISEKYMLGYSIPTSHGGTELPIKAFSGRKVHLLGGSPNAQIAYWSEIPNDVISLDNNYLHKIAYRGQAWLLNGDTISLSELNTIKNIEKGIKSKEIGFGDALYTSMICLAISLTNFSTFWRKKQIENIEEVLYGRI
jgi:hypothetical protein